MQVHLLQQEFTYNVETDEGDYTVTLMEDLASGTISYEVWDDDGEEVTDDDLILYLVQTIETQRS